MRATSCCFLATLEGHRLEAMVESISARLAGIYGARIDWKMCVIAVRRDCAGFPLLTFRDSENLKYRDLYGTMP